MANLLPVVLENDAFAPKIEIHCADDELNPAFDPNAEL
jgi:hypothetical protein